MLVIEKPKDHKDTSIKAKPTHTKHLRYKFHFHDGFLVQIQFWWIHDIKPTQFFRVNHGPTLLIQKDIWLAQ